MRTKKPKLQLDPKEKALLIHSLLTDKKALDPVILDLQAITLICDYFVICSGTSHIHIHGLVDYLLDELDKKGMKNKSIEGDRNSDWVLIDYGDVIVHIFSAELRDFYALERLWGDAQRVPPKSDEEVKKKK